MPRYSIIVPIYNTEPYLAECVESVLNQVGDISFELILVDNGSQDNAGAMCDAYAAKDERVRVIHQENRRPGGGRNAGLQIAQGEYVFFLDSDDLWEPNLLSVVDRLLTAQQDMAQFSFYNLYQDGRKEVSHLPLTPQGASGVKWLEELFSMGTGPHNYPWCYVYRREFLLENHICFREDLLGPEDFIFNMQAIPLAASIVGVDAPLYDFRIRQNSTTRCGSLKTVIDDLETKAEVFRRMPEAPIANLFAGTVVLIADFPKEEAAEAIALIKQNRHILDAVSSGAWIRLLSPLTRVFGIYQGAKIYQILRGFQGKR